MDTNPLVDQRERNQRTLDRQLDGIGWALLLIMMGGLWLIRDVPEGVWLTGAGLILLGINGVRYLNGIRMHTFPSLLGAVALVLGVAVLLGWHVDVFPVLLIVVGASIFFSVFMPKGLKPPAPR